MNQIITEFFNSLNALKQDEFHQNLLTLQSLLNTHNPRLKDIISNLTPPNNSKITSQTLPNDGFEWIKIGRKNSSSTIKHYFKCKSTSCTARRVTYLQNQTQHSYYKNQHNHGMLNQVTIADFKTILCQKSQFLYKSKHYNGFGEKWALQTAELPQKIDLRVRSNRSPIEKNNSCFSINCDFSVSVKDLCLRVLDGDKITCGATKCPVVYSIKEGILTVKNVHNHHPSLVFLKEFFENSGGYQLDSKGEALVRIEENNVLLQLQNELNQFSDDSSVGGLFYQQYPHL